MKKKNIVLIGMPGCGKSTTGVLLATDFSYDFIDTDFLIIREEGKKLPEIIEESGNEGFNRIEENLCATLHVQNSVIATGGSVVYGERGMRNLSNEGIIVFIDVECDEIIRRIGDFSQRGIVLGPGQTIKSLFEERRPLYQKYADITVDTSGLTLAESSELIGERVREVWASQD